MGHVDGPHAGPLHTPAVHESPGGQGRHAEPPVPHAEVLVPVSQLPVLSQQPMGHVMALQVTPWHEPETHVSPDGHTAHALPPVPHSVVTLPGSHRPDVLQHPVGQVEALQGGGRQPPPLQLSPDGHAVHVAPPVPQALVLVPVSQNPRASQQPVGHVVGPHAMPMHNPARHESPGGHGTHAKPPAPHAEVLVPDSHMPPLSQQPVAQLRGLQVIPSHAPMKQTSPVGHAAHASPPLPHAEELEPD